MIELNREMERLWRNGTISFVQFDWHLRWMNGV